MSYNNWRDDPGLESQTEYKRRFAVLPVRCSDNTLVFFKHYYSKFIHWGYRHGKYDNLNDYYLHTDFIENISEAEYIVRKLSENL